MSQTILEMTKDLVVAQIRSGTLSPEEMQEALGHIYQQLRMLQSMEEAERPVSAADIRRAPVDWRQSITSHSITCLDPTLTPARYMKAVTGYKSIICGIIGKLACM